MSMNSPCPSEARAREHDIAVCPCLSCADLRRDYGIAPLAISIGPWVFESFGGPGFTRSVMGRRSERVEREERAS